MASDSSTSFTELRSSCLCQQLRVSIEVPTSSLPLKSNLCHCEACRHVSGLLCVTSTVLPKHHKPLQVQGEAQQYRTSDRLARYFCDICGASVYDHYLDSSQICLCTGALEKVEGLIELNCHLFVADTIDGGLRNWLPDVP